MGKGSTYERAICKHLSRWWTHGKRDDIFWRTAGSGGRATARRKRGQSTAMQGSDVTATDPIGAPLIDVFSIELKRGYTRFTFQDTIDLLPNRKKPVLLQWVDQAERSSADSGSFAWLLIHKRTQRSDIVYIPSHAVLALKAYGALNGCDPRCAFVVDGTKLLATTLAEFLRCVTPEQIQQMAKEV